ncbi:MAG: sensor histidine kinase, partial [Nitrospirae bacterium]
KLYVDKDIKIDIDIKPKHVEVVGDKRDLESMFYYLLQNSLEALEPEDKYIRISSDINPSAHNRLDIEIYNTGSLPNVKDTEQLFQPFYSTKPYGSGFGLTIARLAAKKNFGTIEIKPLNIGTKTLLSLPYKRGDSSRDC